MFQDLTLGARALRHNPGFAAAAILTLALGIGGVAAVVSLVEAVLLRPLPVQEPSRLAMIWEHNLGSGNERNVAGPYNFIRWRERNHSFTDMTGFVRDDTFAVNVAGDFEPERVSAAFLFTNFFDVLGVAPRLGRGFVAEDGADGAAEVVLIGAGYWQRRFGSDPGAIGRTLEVNGKQARIVGVMRNDLPFVAGTDIYQPIQVTANLRNGRGRWLRVVGRLRPDTSAMQAREEMRALAAQLVTERPEFNTGWSASVFPLQQDLVREARPGVLALLGVVALVLLVAAANVSNLLLSRALAREREIALRTALGASFTRLLRQLLAESAVLGACGALCGIVLGYAALQFLGALLPPELVLAAPLRMNVASLGATLAIALGASLAAGLVPALTMLRPALATALKEGRGARGGNRGKTAARGALVVTEIALSIVGLAAAGLLLRSFWRLADTSPGYEAANAQSAQVNLTIDDEQKQSAFFTALVATLQKRPGVTAAGAISWAPFDTGSATSFRAMDREAPRAGEEPGADVRIVTPNLFAAHGIPLLRGRDFTASDQRGARDVVIVNQALAEAFWPGQDPLGKHIGMEWGREIDAEIVGVVGDVRLASLAKPARNTLYWPHEQVPNSFMTVVVRSQRSQQDVYALVRAAVAELDPRIPVAPVESLAERVSASLSARRTLLVLIGAFAALALCMAAIGLYGVLSYMVTQRLPEIGVRMALGADARAVARLVLGDGMKLVAAGVAAGLCCALAASRLIANLLFGVTPWDPAALGGVVALTLLVAVAALAVPAHRASATDPVVALRHE